MPTQPLPEGAMPLKVNVQKPTVQLSKGSSLWSSFGAPQPPAPPWGPSSEGSWGESSGTELTSSVSRLPAEAAGTVASRRRVAARMARTYNHTRRGQMTFAAGYAGKTTQSGANVHRLEKA